MTMTLTERTELALIEFGFNTDQAEFLARVASNPLLQAVQRERDRQEAKWGVHDHPSFDMSEHSRVDRVAQAEEIKAEVNRMAKEGGLTWELILAEEMAEALAETTNADALRTELIQVAAVAIAWIESVNRQAATGE